ncbi:MAG: hypothetical protein PF443_05895 [Allgaiera sp.]|jgi:DnaJ-class molecular chaperone|nr:hypothetical protein [Allgaiera sp.]
MTPTEARTILAVDSRATEHEIRGAYRRVAGIITQSPAEDEAIEPWCTAEDLRAARDLLIGQLNGAIKATNPCPMCKGSGIVAQGFSQMICARCTGTGVLT